MNRESSPLQLIFHRPRGTDLEALESTAVYEILYLFSENGPVDKETLDRVYLSMHQRTAQHPVSFNTVDDLKDFALSVCQDLRSPEVFVLSVQDYNIGVEAARDVKAFRELFRRYGVNIPNPDIINKGSGLIGRWFKK